MQEARERKLLRRQEAAIELDMSVWTFDRWVRSGKAPAPVIRGARIARWSPAQLRKFRSEQDSTSSNE